MKNRKTWAVVANGAKAKIVGDLGCPEVKPFVIEFNREHESIEDLTTDRAGRRFPSVGKSRFGLELHSDPVRNQERMFVERLADELLEHFRDGKMRLLIVAASPRTLGDLRRAFSKELLDSIVCEVNKDFTGLPEKTLLTTLDKLEITHRPLV